MRQPGAGREGESRVRQSLLGRGGKGSPGAARGAEGRGGESGVRQSSLGRGGKRFF